MDFLIDTLISELDGEIRFSPWGYKSYYIIPDSQKRGGICAFLKVYFTILLSFMLIIAFFKFWLGLIAIPFLLLWYYLRIANFIKGLEKQLW